MSFFRKWSYYAWSLLEMGLGVPQTVRMYNMLRQRGIDLPRMPLTVEQLGEMILDMTRARGLGREAAEV